jgi:DNA-binding response OmpR family regulator
MSQSIGTGAQSSGMDGVVLLCLPNAELRCQIRRFLNELGLQVMEADEASEIEGIAAQPWSQVDLLLTDSSIHSRGGPVSEAIRLRSDLKLLVISGVPECKVADTRVHFIEKPFAWRELRGKLRQILKRRALE